MSDDPRILAGDEFFRIVRRFTNGVTHDVLEQRDGQDAMGETRWREMSGGAAIQAMKKYIIRQAEGTQTNGTSDQD